MARTPPKLTIASRTTTPARIAQKRAVRDRQGSGPGGTLDEGLMRKTLPYQSLDHTLRSMGKLAKRSVDTDAVRSAAEDAVRSAGLTAEASHDRLADAVYRWVRSHVRYRLDPSGKEYLKGPVAILRAEDPAEDCDGQSMLAASMLSSLGVPTGFRAVAQRQENTFNHVYGIYRSSGGRWKGIDPTIEKPPQQRLHDALAQKDFLLSTMSVQTTDPTSQRSAVDLGASTSPRKSRAQVDLGESESFGEWWDNYLRTGDTSGGGDDTTSGGSSGGGTTERILEDVLGALPDTILAFKGRNPDGSGGQTPTQPTAPTVDPVGGGSQKSSLLTNPLVVGGGLVAAGLVGYSMMGDDS